MTTRGRAIVAIILSVFLVAAIAVFLVIFFGGAFARGPKSDFTNTLGMKFKLIPAGEFQMGSPDGKNGGEKARIEEIQHNVRITKPYYLGVNTVTRRQFARFVAEQDYKTDAERDGKGANGMGSEVLGEVKSEYTWKNPGFTQTDDHPVVCVSWNDAAAYCDWLSKKEKKEYRLPTEAEWEYACRAGSRTRYYFGDNPEDLVRYANVRDETYQKQFPNSTANMSGADGYVYTAPVGSFRANAFGLYDMHGNVCQWCADRYLATYSWPTDDPTGPPTGSTRSIRGSCYLDMAFGCRSAGRGKAWQGSQNPFLGFRVALVP